MTRERYWVCEWCYPGHPDASLMEQKPDKCGIVHCPIHRRVWGFPSWTKPLDIHRTKYPKEEEGSKE